MIAFEETSLDRADRADAHLNRDGRYASIRGGVLYATRDFASSDGAYDLYIHFHGNTRVVLESAEHVHLNALVAIVNLGVGSAPYEDAYAMPGSYKALLEGIARGAAERGLAAPHVRRIAIGTWSAGYGAVSGILRQKDGRDGLDALLCMDGIHVGYNEEGPHEPKRLNLAPFIDAAKSAARGEFLFSITHSSVIPEGYASTTETADVLLDEVGARRATADASEAPEHVEIAAAKGAVAKRLEKSLEPTTEAQRGRPARPRLQGRVARGPHGAPPPDGCDRDARARRPLGARAVARENDLAYPSGSGAAPLAPTPMSMMQGQEDSNGLRRYRLIAEIGHGGMADVFLAVAQGPVGFNKLVVIKKARKDLLGEADILAMFLDEARLAARLNHPNVVQTYEIGQEGDRYFIAMEYLDGQPLNRVLSRCGARIPTALKLRDFIEVLAAFTTRTSSATSTARRFRSSTATRCRRTCSSRTTAASRSSTSASRRRSTRARTRAPAS